MIVENRLFYWEFWLGRFGSHPVSPTWYGWRVRVCAVISLKKLHHPKRIFLSAKSTLIQFLPFTRKNGQPRMEDGKMRVRPVDFLLYLFPSLTSFIGN